LKPSRIIIENNNILEDISIEVDPETGIVDVAKHSLNKKSSNV